MPIVLFYLHQSGNTLGPFDEPAIIDRLRTGKTSPSAVACVIGETKWRPLQEVIALRSDLAEITSQALPPLPSINFKREAAAAFNKVAATISLAAGIEKLEGLNGKDFLSGVWKWRTDDDIEALFITGTKLTTPALEAVDSHWPKPWAFSKAFLASLIVFIGFFYGVVQFQNPKLLPGLMFVGSFAIPFSTLIFFVEMNVPRNVSLYQVFKLLFVGGMVAILITLFANRITTNTPDNAWDFASGTAIIEECAKLLTVILLMGKRRFTWTLNGLLLGAAVGTGFAAFESAGYILESLFGELQGQDSMMVTLILRAFLSPASHIVWTGLAAAALWKVKGSRLFEWEMLKDTRFLRIFGLVVALHFIWDCPIGIPFMGDLGFILKFLFLGVVAWITVLAYVQYGLKEIRLAQEQGNSLGELFESRMQGSVERSLWTDGTDG